MTTFQKLKHEARRAEQRSDWRKAITLYREALRFDERQGGAGELGLFNRIGDLHIRLGEVRQAVECYEQAANRYAENQLPTSAVALCNKILRIAPERTDVFRRLSLLHATTGLLAEARTTMLQYVDRMESTGNVEAALEAVQQFVDATGDDSTRLKVADLLAERGHRAHAVAQIRFVAATARTRGENTSEYEVRIRELEEPCEIAPGGETEHSPDASAVQPIIPPSRDATGLAHPTASMEAAAVHLGREVAAALDESGSGPSAFDPDHQREEGPECRRASGQVADELAEFEAALAIELKHCEPEVHYDLGVAFQAMGLAGEAVRELQASMSDPGLQRRACERIWSILEPADDVGDPEPFVLVTADSDDLETTELSEPPDQVPVVDEEPPATESLESDLQSQFFRARLAQYQIRRAEEAGGKDHRSHLDLGAAYVEMGLAVEAVRELSEAATAGGHVAARAVEMLLNLARDSSTSKEVVFDILERLCAEGREDTVGPVADELAERWGEGHPDLDRLAALAGRQVEPDTPGSAGHFEEAPANPPLVEGSTEEPESQPEEPASLETLDDLLGQLEGDSFGIVVPVNQERSADASRLCAEADFLLRQGHEEEAAARLFRALEMLEDARDLGEAIYVVDLLLGLRPDDVVLHHQRAEFALGLNDRETLIESYMGLAASLRRQQAPDSARTVYTRVLEIDEDHSEAREELAALSESPFAPSRDLVDLDDRPAGPGPEQAAVPESGSEIGSEAGNDCDADAADSADFDALLQDLGDGDEDDVVFEGDTQAHFELGVAFKQMEMWEEALAEFERAVPGRDDPRPVWEAMADCHVRLDDADRALQVLLEAEAHPVNRALPSPEIAYRIARLYERRDRPSEAIEWLLQVIAIDPDFQDAAGRLSALSG